VPETLKLNKNEIFQDIKGQFNTTMKMEKITKLAKIKIENYKFVIFDI